MVSGRPTPLDAMMENPMETPADNPGVIVRPPLLYLAALLVMLSLRWLVPLPISHDSRVPWLGLLLIVPGVAIAIAGRRALQAAGTNVNPSRPTTVVTSSGPYRFSRNPLYVSLTLMFLGLTLAANTWWGIVLLVPVLMLMHFGVVLREERYLDRKFGERYRQYRARVRRYV